MLLLFETLNFQKEVNSKRHTSFKDDRAFSIISFSLLVTSGTPSDFGIMLSLVPVVKIFEKKNWGHRENLGESGGQTFKGSDREKRQF